MGKGDIRSRRGKIWRGTTGVTRPRQKSKGIRPTAPSRKVKSLKDISKAVTEPIVKKSVVEAVKHHVAETVPVIEKVQPLVVGVTAEVPQIVAEPITAASSVETKSADKKTKASAKKTAKPAAKKAAPAKKASAKKVTAKKKK